MTFAKTLTAALILVFFTFPASALDVFALGTSNTNCKNANQSYTRKLNELLKADGINVINGGSDGDKPIWMQARLQTALSSNPEIKLVIFEPGPNERNKEYSLKPSAEILSWLQEKKIPTIYVSHTLIQNFMEAPAFAKQFDAHYYGDWTRGIPLDREHRLYDQPGSPGHLSVKGCEIWAEQMAPLIKEVARKHNLINWALDL